MSDVEDVVARSEERAKAQALEAEGTKKKKKGIIKKRDAAGTGDEEVLASRSIVKRARTDRPESSQVAVTDLSKVPTTETFVPTGALIVETPAVPQEPTGQSGPQPSQGPPPKDFGWPYKIMSDPPKKMKIEALRYSIPIPFVRQAEELLAEFDRHSVEYPVGRQESVYEDPGVAARLTANALLQRDADALSYVDSEALNMSTIWHLQKSCAQSAVLQQRLPLLGRYERVNTELKSKLEIIRREATVAKDKYRASLEKKEKETAILRQELIAERAKSAKVVADAEAQQKAALDEYKKKSFQDISDAAFERGRVFGHGTGVKAGFSMVLRRLRRGYPHVIQAQLGEPVESENEEEEAEDEVQQGTDVGETVQEAAGQD